MPDKIDDCVEELMAHGHDESSAHAISKASITDQSFDETELCKMLKSNGADEWVSTVGRLARSDVEQTVIADVVKQALNGGSRHQAKKTMAKSERIEKVGFEARMNSKFTVFKAGEDDFVIWGPASVEIVDKEGDKIQAKALQKALPQLLKRARLSLEHSDQLVGSILERFDTEDPVEIEIDGRSYKRKDFPTDVLELDGMEPALFVAGDIYNDSRQARDTRKRIKEGELNSYSISGEALVTQKRITSDGESYDDIVDIDLSAVTVCEEGMNQGAKFAQIEESGNKEAAATAKSDDRNTPTDGVEREAPTVSDVATIAKDALNTTMSETDKSGDDSEGSFDAEALTDEFKSVLDDKLPDGELATKQDVPGEDNLLTREDVESIAREIYAEDTAGEEDDEDEGTSDAEGRPGEEADVTGEEAKEDVPGEEDDEDEEVEVEAGDEAEKGVDALAQALSVDTEKAASIMEALKGSYEDEISDEEEEVPPPEIEEEPPAPEEEEEEVPVPEDEEEEAPPVPEEEEEEKQGDEPPMPGEEEETPEEDMGSGYSQEELEEMLPTDVYEVVREYLDEGSNGGDEVMASAKEEDIESAVEKILSGTGLEADDGDDEPVEKTGSATVPSGDVQKSYEDTETESSAGDNPALSNFYGN